MSVERWQKKPVTAEMVLWDGTPERAEFLKEWTADCSPGGPGFLLPDEMFGVHEHARLWVAHQRTWTWVPVGHRVVKEQDGDGFYPLSPGGHAAAYERPTDG